MLDDADLCRFDPMVLEQSVEFAVDFRQPQLQHLFEPVEQRQLCVEGPFAFAANRPQATADWFEAERVLLRTHVASVEQGHVPQLYPPVADAFVVSDVRDEVADADFQIEFVMPDKADA